MALTKKGGGLPPQLAAAAKKLAADKSEALASTETGAKGSKKSPFKPKGRMNGKGPLPFMKTGS